jgi:GxxExxY protein
MDCAFTLHRSVGPGFREAFYATAFCLELEWRGLRFEREKRISVKYRHWEIPGHKVDLIVEGVVLVEIKSVPRLRPIHRAQVIAYLKATGLRVGLLVNFNSVVLKDGFQRIVV